MTERTEDKGAAPMKTITLGLAQLSPVLRDNEANIETIRHLVLDMPDTDLLVFPELFLGGYTTKNVDRLAIRSDGPELERLREIAWTNSTALVFGAAEETPGGTANSAVCVNERGEISAIYRKVQLFGSEKSDAFVPGEELVIAELFGFKVGLMICFDLEFPEVARKLARSGADLLLTISANMEPFGKDHAIFATARALENGLPHVYVNQTGPGDDDLAFTGGSMVVSPDGDELARARDGEEAVVGAELTLPMRSGARENYLEELRDPMPPVESWEQQAGPDGLQNRTVRESGRGER